MPTDHQQFDRRGSGKGLGEANHLPVMPEEVQKYLNPQAGESYLDLTAGYGGHAELVMTATGCAEKSLLVDRDEQANKTLTRKFPQSRLMHSDFVSATKELVAAKQNFDMILADLGISSPHIDNPDRGFAFAQTGPLDMRMDQRQSLMAEAIVNQAAESELAEILFKNGEEPAARAIAKAIVQNRPIGNTKELSELIARAVPRKGRAKIHPATRAFQALRIAVNDELGQLEQGLPLMCELLAPGGRLVVISFHSLEDRIVKNYLADASGDRYDAELTLLTKRPITPSPAEIAFNPRARSAKLRAASKKTKKKGIKISHADSGNG